MRVILRRLIPNALELAAANAHDRRADFIMKLGITFHLQRVVYRKVPIWIVERGLDQQLFSHATRGQAT